jgi:hypothetical protein
MSPRPSDTSLLTACAAPPKKPGSSDAVVRELRRGSLTWSDTRAWRESTPCPPPPLSHPHLTLGSPILGSNLIPPSRRREDRHATSPPFRSHHACPLVSATPRGASKDRNPNPPPALSAPVHVPHVCTASLLHQHRVCRARRSRCSAEGTGSGRSRWCERALCSGAAARCLAG